jgi:hypothetical protein
VQLASRIPKLASWLSGPDTPFRETASQRIRTLSLVTHDNPEYTHVIDFPMGSRPSSLVIPRYGTCADMEGFAGADNLDPAAGSGA